MPVSIYFQCLVAGVLGILFHIFVLKLPALKKRAVAANVEFSPKNFFKEEWISVGSSVITVAIALLVMDELLNFKPSIYNALKGLFVFVGFTGSSILQHALGKTEKAVLNVIDRKTNIADGITGAPAEVVPPEGGANH